MLALAPTPPTSDEVWAAPIGAVSMREGGRFRYQNEYLSGSEVASSVQLAAVSEKASSSAVPYPCPSSSEKTLPWSWCAA